jgi:hypothetical protein
MNKQRQEKHKVCVTGCRDFKDYEKFAKTMRAELDNMNISFIISGGATGTDEMAERFCEENGIVHITLPAQWKKYGPKAGPMRNQLMAELTNATIAFWDEESKGTWNMIENARRAQHRYVSIHSTHQRR